MLLVARVSAMLTSWIGGSTCVVASICLPRAGPISVFLCGRNSVVECQLPKLDVEGSNPFARSYVTLAESST